MDPLKTAEGTGGAPTCLYSTHKKGRTGQVLSVDGREKRVDERRGEGRWAYLEQKTKHGAETAPVKGRSHRVSVVYLFNNTSGREQGG
jgi:hypothetical protein